MEPKGVRIGGILANICKRDGRGTANFRDLYASRLISVAGDCIYYIKYIILVHLSVLLSDMISYQAYSS